MTAIELNQPNSFKGEQPLKILVVGSVSDAIQQARYYEKRLSDERFEARLALDIRRGDKTFSDSDARKVLILTANHVGTALDLYAKNQDLKAIVFASTLFNEWWHTPEDYNARPHMVAWHRGAKIVGIGWCCNGSGIKYNRKGERSNRDFDLHEGHYFSLLIERADLGKIGELYKIVRPAVATDHHPTSSG